MMMEATANLHEETVQHAEEHARTHHPKRARAKQRGRTRTTRDVKVDPRVMSKAQALVRQRPGTRVRVLDAETVLVENVPTA